MDRKACGAAVHGVTKSWTQLSDQTELSLKIPQFFLRETWLWERSPVFFLFAANNKSSLLPLLALVVSFESPHEKGNPVFW